MEEKYKGTKITRWLRDADDYKQLNFREDNNTHVEDAQELHKRKMPVS